MKLLSIAALFASSVAVAAPEPYPANTSLYFANDAVNSEYIGKLVSIEGQIVRIEPGPQQKPMYELALPHPVNINIWVASLVASSNPEYEIGQIIRALGYLQEVSDNDTFTQSVTTDKYHVLGFCILNINTLKASYLPAGVKQCEGWQNGKQPNELM